MAAMVHRARPRRFDEVVGQEHVKDVLLAALRRGRVGHAYLFSGPRGVGKTTSARLLAMALNCDAPAEQRPCGACESCLMVQRGEHPDVIELDAASNNSVDDVRDLREKVRLASLRGGSRVWVLDEAHMLSRAAANALLKTLEEPPPGLVFVLATTEPEKLPATVLSRCQHFRFRRLSEGEIAGKLERLVAEAGVEVEAGALALVARAADGAMRDAESLLERLLVSGERITRATAEGALGLPPRERLLALASALAATDWDALLGEAGTLYRDGFAPRTIAEQLGRTLRDLLLARLAGGEGDAGGLDPDALIRAIDTLEGNHERFVRQGDLYALEVVLLRVARSLQVAPSEPVASPPERTGASVRPVAAAEAAPVAASARPTRAAAPASDDPPPFEPLERAKPAASARATPSSRPAAETGAQIGADEGEGFTWHHLMTRAPTQLKAFLQPAAGELDEGVLTLRYSERHAFHHTQLRKRETELLALIDELGGAPLEVVIEGPSGRDRHRPRSGGGRERAKKS
jgi:DNA polymerase III subunit gamma/tau